MTRKMAREEAFILVFEKAFNDATVEEILEEGIEQGASDIHFEPNESKTITFDLDTSIVGTFDYKLVVESDDDTSTFNNNYMFTQTVSEKLQMLFISSNNSYFGLLNGVTITIVSSRVLCGSHLKYLVTISLLQ